MVVDIPITHFATGNEPTQHRTRDVAERGQGMVLHLLCGAVMACAR